MIKIIEKFNIKWESGEKKKFKIQYIDYKGTTRNYFPDFILNEKYMVECKPKSLMMSKTVLLKQKYAIEKCKNLGLIYKLTNIKLLSQNQIKILHDTRKIKFLPRYESKYQKYIKNYD